MSRKDYQLIAAVLQAEKARAARMGQNEGIAAIAAATMAMADALAGTNPLFDRGRFLKACA